MESLPTRMVALLSLSFVLCGSRVAAEDAAALAGVWQAAVPFGPNTVELSLEIRGTTERGLRGQIVNVSQDDAAFPIDGIEVDGSSVRIRACALTINPFVVVIGAAYEGTLSDDATTIRGTLSNGGRFPVEFRRSDLPRRSEETALGEALPGVGRSGPECAHPARDAAERIIASLPGLVERGDRAEFRAFVAANFAQSMQSAGVERWVDVLSTFHHASHGFELRGVQEAGSNWASGLLRNRLTGDWTMVNVLAGVEDPHPLIGWSFFPSAAPNPITELTNTRRIGRELEAYVERLASGDVFSGAVLLAKDGEVVFEGAYGMANKDFEARNTIDTKFNLSSMFTAVAIMQLVGAGELSLSEPLSKFIPDFPDEDSAQKIRIEHLLTHTAGLGDHFTAHYMETSKTLYRTVDDFMTLIADQTLQFEPGTRWQYSNAGFVVLGKIIEVVTGDDYYDYIRRNVYGPAGMTNSDHYELDGVNPNLAVGYTRLYTDNGIDYRNNTYISLRGSPGGGGYSTARDLLRFTEALLGSELLGSENLELMLSSKPELNAPRNGYGFDINSEFSRVGHAGGSIGAYSSLDIFLDSGWTGIVLSNYSEGNVPAYPSVIAKIRTLVGGGNGGPG